MWNLPAPMAGTSTRKATEKVCTLTRGVSPRQCHQCSILDGYELMSSIWRPLLIDNHRAVFQMEYFGFRQVATESRGTLYCARFEMIPTVTGWKKSYHFWPLTAYNKGHKEYRETPKAEAALDRCSPQSGLTKTNRSGDGHHNGWHLWWCDGIRRFGIGLRFQEARPSYTVSGQKGYIL
jgi:hypothetical protein